MPGVSADEIIGDNKPPGGGTLVCQFVYNRSGRVGDSGWMAKVYKAGSGMYLMLDDSPMKIIDYNQKPWAVEDLEGYFEGTAAKEQFRKTLVEQVEKSARTDHKVII